MMYRKPAVKIMDRHTLIELDGDFTDYEIRHLLNKAYLNHKAPHEYDELKKYIRDLVIGKHNSVYIMNNGNPNPLASAAVIGAPYLSTLQKGANLYYDWFGTIQGGGCSNAEKGLTNNPTNCSSNTVGADLWLAAIYGYNNGNGVENQLYYTTEPFPQQPVPPTSSEPSLLVGLWVFDLMTQALPKYKYAPYITSNNPLTLTTYSYWNGTGNSGASSLSFNYVYFGLLLVYNYANDSCGSGSGVPSLMPLFSSSGSFTFQANTYYIGMWQWTYT